MIYKFSVDEKNDVISKLVGQYPKTFFAIGRHRAPLMKNIVTSLQQDGFPVAGELISESVDWYMSHVGYQHSLEAGRRRVNLRGVEEGTVTESEERAAKKKITEINEKKLNQRHVYDPTKTAAKLQAQFSDDQLKKIDAPKLASKPKSTAPSPVCPELEPVYQALLTASAAMPALASNTDMQIALLKVISKEVEHVIASIRPQEGKRESDPNEAA